MSSPARAALRAALLSMSAAIQRALAEARLPATEDYDVVRADLVNRLTDAFLTFVSSARGGGAQNAARRALAEDVSAAYYRGYRDAGGEEVDDADEAWLTAAAATQLAYLENTFDSLKVQRQNDSATADGLKARAEVWGVTLDGIYAEGKLRGRGNIMLTFKRRPGAKPSEHPCAECRKYDGKRHSAKWWVKRDLVRRNGNDAYGCGRWEACTHSFFTDDGELYAR